MPTESKLTKEKKNVTYNNTYKPILLSGASTDKVFLPDAGILKEFIYILFSMNYNLFILLIPYFEIFFLNT